MYKRPASQEEREGALYLAELLTRGESTGEILRRRLTDEQRSRLEQAVRDMDDVLQSALDSMPEGTRQLIKRSARNSVVRITPRAIGALDDGYLAVNKGDLDVLARAAMRGDSVCVMCMRTRDQVRACKLREVLRRHYELRDSKYGMCGYAGVKVCDNEEELYESLHDNRQSDI